MKCIMLENILDFTVAAVQGPRPHANNGRYAMGDIIIDNNQYDEEHSVLIEVRGLRFFTCLVGGSSELYKRKFVGTSREVNSPDELVFSDFDTDDKGILLNGESITQGEFDFDVNLLQTTSAAWGVSSWVLMMCKKDVTNTAIDYAIRVKNNI